MPSAPAEPYTAPDSSLETLLLYETAFCGRPLPFSVHGLMFCSSLLMQGIVSRVSANERLTALIADAGMNGTWPS